MSEPTYKTRLFVVLHGMGGNVALYSTDPPEVVREQLGGTCLWVKDADGVDVQLNLREIPVVAVMPNES